MLSQTWSAPPGSLLTLRTTACVYNFYYSQLKCHNQPLLTWRGWEAEDSELQGQWLLRGQGLTLVSR